MIRSFYLRNNEEVEAVKNLLHQMRGNTPSITHKLEIKKALETCEPATQNIGISVEDFLAKHPSKEPQETPEPQEKDWIGAVGTLPNWMLDVINGSFPPPPEENTAIQNKVFNDGEFQDVCKSYQKTHDPELFKVAISIAERCGVEL